MRKTRVEISSFRHISKERALENVQNSKQRTATSQADKRANTCCFRNVSDDHQAQAKRRVERVGEQRCEAP